MKKLKRKPCSQSVTFWLFFHILKIPFQRYSEKPEHFSCQNISKIYWKQAESYKKQNLFCTWPIKGWFISLLISRVEIRGAMDEIREPGTPTRAIGGAGQALMFSHVLPPARRRADLQHSSQLSSALCSKNIQWSRRVPNYAVVL